MAFIGINKHLKMTNWIFAFIRVFLQEEEKGGENTLKYPERETLRKSERL